jgi:NADH:ubiquinone oxidoreductase subunit 2 (subunit N)
MLQSIHSTLAYAVLAVIVFAIVNAFLGLSAKRNFTKKDRSLSLIALIFSHIQLVVGLILWVFSPLGKEAMSQMSNAALRLTAVEHPLINIIAIVLITIGWSKHKKEESSNGKFKKIGIFYALGLIFLISRIPFKHWLGL